MRQFVLIATSLIKNNNPLNMLYFISLAGGVPRTPSVLQLRDGVSCSAPYLCTPRMSTLSSRQPVCCTTSSPSRTLSHLCTWTVRTALATSLQGTGVAAFKRCKGMARSLAISLWRPPMPGTSRAKRQRPGTCSRRTSAATLGRCLGSGANQGSAKQKLSSI